MEAGEWDQDGWDGLDFGRGTGVGTGALGHFDLGPARGGDGVQPQITAG